MEKINLIAVAGPTAGGKTAFAAQLAHRLGGEIISADSRQVYKNMDIGTGKDFKDYMVEGEQIQAHLIDIREPGYKYNVYEYQQDFIKAFDDIRKKNKVPVLAGGSGLYIEAVLNGYRLIQVPPDEKLRAGLEDKNQDDLVKMLKNISPALHNTTDIKHKKRTIRAIEIATFYRDHPDTDQYFPEIHPVVIGIKFDRNSRRKRITERLHARIEEGMIEEVKRLLEYISEEDLIFYGLEYKYITLYLNGTLRREEMIKKLETAIHQFAKRQMTWFRKMERSGVRIHWLDGQMQMEEKLERTKAILQKYTVYY
jgi:tRNA dimethylallyltransferase